MVARFEIDNNIGEVVADLGEQTGQATLFNIAYESEQVLRSRSMTIWPQDTGQSRLLFRAESDQRDDVLVLNTATYAAAVNNRRYYPGGRANPNFHAAQRTIERLWSRIVDAATRRLAGAEQF